MGTALLERDEEFDVLEAARRRAAAGSGSVGLLSGEAGIGKTSVDGVAGATRHDLGARPMAARVRHRLRGMGVSVIPRGPAPTTRTNPAGLTDRQAEILRLVAAGKTNAEIAAHLVVSVRTVDHHVSAVLQKLGVTGRRDAAAVAAAIGLT